jgi:hypothetical protein
VASYIYTLMQATASGKAELINTTSKKWALKAFIREKFLDVGWSIDSLVIYRSKDCIPNSATSVDPYEFMEIDLGEVE